MLILAIDPGQTHSGVLLYDVAEDAVRDCTGAVLNTEIVAWKDRWPAANFCVVIEDFTPLGQMTGHAIVDSCKWVGRIQQHFIDLGRPTLLMERNEVLDRLTPAHREIEADWRREVKEAKALGVPDKDLPRKPNRDKALWYAICERYGGEERAIGGVKCAACRGKKWTGRAHEPCGACSGSGWAIPPGPLADVHSHARSALALALAALAQKMEEHE